MTRDEHIAEAERLLDGPHEDMSDWDDARRDNLATAAVHAALAQAKQPLIIVLHPNATAEDIAHLKANLAELWGQS